MRGAELERAIADSRFTVLPSHAYETLGKTILESYARGAGRGGHGLGIAAGIGAERARQDFCTGRAMWSNWRRPSSSSAHNLNWRRKWDAPAGSGCGEGIRLRRTTRRWLVCMSAWSTRKSNRRACRNTAGFEDRPGKDTGSDGNATSGKNRLRSSPRLVLLQLCPRSRHSLRRPSEADATGRIYWRAGCGVEV